MDTDTGLIRKLPPPIDELPEDQDKVKQRNIFEILVNQNDQLLVEGEYMEITELREKAKEFIASEPGNANMPEFKETDIEGLGVVAVSKTNYFIAK